MTKGVVLSLFDLTTTFVRPWADAGYDAFCFDLQHPDGMSETDHPNITLVGGDLRGYDPERWLTPDVVFVAAFPPCTDLAVSGARWFRDKGLRALIDALELVEVARTWGEQSGVPWFLENPVSTISSYWRPPDHTFHPWEYGGYDGGDDDGYSKLTCLWTGGGFRMPLTRPIRLDPATHDRIHKAPPSPERANLRSQTPAGFSRAVFEVHDGGVPIAQPLWEGTP